MKRAVWTLFLIIIIAVTAATWVLLNQAENQKYKIRIVDFKWTSNWGPGPVNVMWGGSFNVTLHNMGNMPVEGVVVEVKQFDNNSAVGSGTYFDGFSENVTFGLQAGEIRDLKVHS